MKRMLLSLSAFFLMAGLAALEIDHSYRIVISDKKEVQDAFAANELAGYLEKVSGEKFTVVTESAIAGAKAIYVGNTIAAAKAGKFVPDEFRIFTSGKDVIIAGSPQRGVLFGVYEFLERFAGVRFFTPECERIPSKKVLKVPDGLDIRHKPAFAYRFIYGGKRAGGTTAFFRKMRLTGWGGGMAYGSSARFGTDGQCHTYYKYSKDFPEEISWADKSGTRHVVKTALEGSICFSNPEVLKRFAERLKANIAADRRKAEIQKLPPPQYYSVSQNDCDAACGCAKCAKFIAEHGVSGLVIDFTNRLAEIVCRDHPEIKIQIFAYFDSLNPPKTAIRAHKNVIVQITTYTQKFHDHLRAVDDPVNAKFKTLMSAWKKHADDLGIWDYWRYFNGFKPSASAALILPGYIRFYKECGVVMFFTEFETSPKDLLSFYDLTIYVGARMLDDPSRDPQPLIDEFMETYYGAAAPAMKKLLDLLTLAVSRDKVCGEQLRFDQRAYMKDPEFFRQAFALVNEAEKAVSGNPLLKTRVHQEKLLLESSCLKAWSAHKNKLKLDRKKLQADIGEMLGPVLRSFFAPEVLNKKAVAESERYYADKIIFGKPQNVKAVPLPGFAANDSSVKIVEFAKVPCTGRKISDPDSPSGKAFSHSANYSSEMRVKRHQRPFEFGLYERSHTKYLVYGSIRAGAIPQDEKYHWYHAGTTRLYPSLSLWIHWTWGLSVSIGRFYNENNPDKKYEIYLLMKLQGPAYVRNSEKPNDVRLAAIAFKEAAAGPAEK